MGQASKGRGGFEPATPPTPARHPVPLPAALSAGARRPSRDVDEPAVEPPAAAVVVATSGGTRTAHPRALRRVGGVTLLERAVRVLRAAGVERVVVVVGQRGEEVTTAIRELRLPVEVVHDPQWADGTAGSVLAGLAVVDDERCLVVMGDHVFDPDDVRRLRYAPGRTVLAVDRDTRRQVGGLGGLPPARVRIGADGQVRALGRDLAENDAVSAGLTVVHLGDLREALAGRADVSTWVEARQAMIESGCELRTSDVGGFWADVQARDDVRALERAMWRRYGPKPTDGIVNRLFTRRISGPLTRLLLRTGMTPDLATVLAFTVTLAAAALVATGNRWLLLAGGLGIVLGFALDGVDGELARVSGRASRRGAVLDTLLDRYADLAVVLALVLAAGGSRSAWEWGFAAGAGCLLVSYIHAVGRDTDVRLLFRREFRLLIFAVAAIAGVPLWGVAAVALAANVDVVRGVVLLLRAMRTG
ncbi:MAG TPA: NTP transferase domain-containing protein [Streptosporangiales bacterium]